MIKQEILLTKSGGSHIRRNYRKRKRTYAGGQTAAAALLAVLSVVFVWFYLVFQNCSSHMISIVPEAVSESTDEVQMPILKQQPIQAECMITGAELLGGHYMYYAGPSENMIKEPGEILIALDPGHGGMDDGCVRGGVLEKELNLSISEKVKERLEKMGYQVILTRDSDHAVSLRERIKTAKEAHADIYVSIHQNSSELSGVNGMELYYSVEHAADDSRRLSELIQKYSLLNTGANERSIFEWEDIYVVREAKMPSCLIETGFLTNAKERGRLKTSEYQEKLAEGIATGVDLYFRP